MTDEPTQRCSKCGYEKPESAFPPSRRGVKGTWCTQCSSSYNLDRYHGRQPEPSIRPGIEGVCAHPDCDEPLEHRAGQADYCSTRCKDAHFYLRNKHRRFWRQGQARRNYNVDYDATFAAQNGECANPNCDRAAEQVDHCHETGAPRGLLCRGCNSALGMARDRIDVLRGLLVYLEEPPGCAPAT